jgi:hypothetical protein
MNQLTLAILGIVGVGTLLLIIEILSRKHRFRPEVVRRVSHLLSTLVALFFSYVLDGIFFSATLFLFVVIMYVSRRYHVLTHIHAVTRKTAGEELLPLGFIAAYLIAGGPGMALTTSLLIIGLADPITGFVMERYQKHPLGFASFTFITLLLLLILTPLSFHKVLFFALVVALVERVSDYGIDNFSVPVTASLLLTYL